MARQTARVQAESVAQVSEVQHVKVAQIVLGAAAFPVPYVAREVDVGEVKLNVLDGSGDRVSVLDTFRFTSYANADKRVGKAVKTLHAHWMTRRPLGPCGFGIGTLFGKLEYPFLRYNLFFYVYVLSFYEAARKSPKFRQALGALEAKVVDSQIVVENPNRGLAKLAFCRKGEPSHLATKRYREILKNVEG